MLKTALKRSWWILGNCHCLCLILFGSGNSYRALADSDRFWVIWLALANAGWLWLALAVLGGSGWLWAIPPFSNADIWNICRRQKRDIVISTCAVMCDVWDGSMNLKFSLPILLNMQYLFMWVVGISDWCMCLVLPRTFVKSLGHFLYKWIISINSLWSLISKQRLDRVNTFGVIKAVSDTIFDMIVTTYHDKPSISSGVDHVEYCVRNSLDNTKYIYSDA